MLVGAFLGSLTPRLAREWVQEPKLPEPSRSARLSHCRFPRDRAEERGSRWQGQHHTGGGCWVSSAPPGPKCCAGRWLETLRSVSD